MQNSKLVWYNNNSVVFNKEFHDLPWFDVYQSFYKWAPLSVAFADRSNIIKSPLVSHIKTPIPNGESDMSYLECCVTRANDIELLSRKNGKPITVLYSGGVDSSTIVCSFLMLGVDINVAMNKTSVRENPSLYEMIKQKCSIIPSGNLDFILSDPNHIIVHGECNDQLFGSASLLDLVSVHGIEITKMKVTKQLLYDLLFDGIKARSNIIPFNSSPEQDTKNLIDKILWPVAENSPLPGLFDSLYKFMWYINFTLKYQNVLMRIFAIKSSNNPHNTTDTFLSFFDSKDFQLWSIKNNLNSNIDSLYDYKMEAKQLIYSMTKDHDYMLYKQKLGSLGFVFKGNTVVEQIDILDNKSNEKITPQQWNYKNAI